MKRIIAWFAQNHVAANLLMIFFLLAGAITALTMKLEVFPETSLDTITISVEYSGASPSEVEEGVIQKIEENIAGLAGIRRIDSKATEGLATIIIEVVKGWDLQKLLDEVKSEVDRITTLPDEAEKPVIRETTRRTQVLWVALFGDVPEASLKAIAQRMKDDITTLPGVTVAELFGVRDSEIHIEVSEQTLKRYNLTLKSVANAVAQASLDLPGGSVKTEGGEILVRAKGRKYLAKEYREVPVITRTDGSKVTLGQIAQIKEGFQDDQEKFARFNGKPAALIQVYRVADQNALDVASEVKEYVEKIRPELPAGVSADFFADRSKILKSRIDLLLRNMLQGLILVVLVLGLFLSARLSFWVTLGIPISFLAAIWFLPFADVSINMISLFAFIMVLGIVVDDAIVVGEQVFTFREEGMEPMKASIEGTSIIGKPVIFSVLTTVAAFMPLMMATGIMGKIMRNIPVVVIAVLIASLIECLFILPSHLAGAKVKVRKAGEKKLSARLLIRFIRGPYFKSLDFCLRWRYATIASGLAVLFIALGLLMGGYIKFTLFPVVEGDLLTANLELPAGAPAEQTIQVVGKLEKAAKKVLDQADQKRPEGSEPLHKYTVSMVGISTGGRSHGGGTSSSGGNLGTVFVELLEGEKRNMSTKNLVADWRQETGVVPEAESLSFTGEMFSPGNPIEVHLSAPSEEELVTAADELKARLATYTGVFDIADSFTPGKWEMQLKLKPAARSLGLTLQDLAQQVRYAFYGAEALRIQRNQDEVRVLVRYPEKERSSLSDVSQMRIRTATGDEVPFSQVAEVTMTRGYTSVDRAQRRRVIKVTADVNTDLANASELRGWLEKSVLPELLAKYKGLRYTMEGAGREERESLSDVLQGFVIALFLIYALLAIPFRSFSQPFIVMAAIPFGLVGALAGHFIMGLGTSLLSLFGMVGLTGVVVNDSLVLIDAANRLRDAGMTPGEAIRQAGPMRFRAIILTSLTTFGGLAPIIFERSLQAQFLIPMAVSLGFGVLFATGVTLVLIPCGYLVLDDIHRIIDRIRGRATQEALAEDD
ncbi:MAG: efflux RND transporter permease subunit [Desulfarculus sp.]|nr:efflux RND transporter permease subunit [Pseudomonadota bacterium]MBV1717368.1 efflux RND transporter permease subunit [Desulfarculus sp.]MBU4576713.1 efflux RND transporter permease subunit [Pseudomonadota bacterium]MBU4596195.1 efflux RND transporter permease subunit [Pseudomonadota bacterium]MBV1739831.1 efflux RND transporter permease subunit [Desulfarculus sp.]